MIDALEIAPVQPAKNFIAEKTEAESQPAAARIKGSGQDPYAFMANMTDQQKAASTQVVNPEQETTQTSASQKVSRRGVFNFRRM